jgi:predicted alpha/beta-fold hydrolase
VSDAPFIAPAWLRNAHLQTLWSPLLRRQASLPRRRERIELPDGDFIDADWLATRSVAPLVVVLHGLSGSGESAYVIGVRRALQRRGLDSVALHFRGSSGEPNRQARGYHAGDTGDARLFLQRLRVQSPQRPLGLLGYSLGGNVALRLLAEDASGGLADAACAVSVPYDLGGCADRLDRGFSRRYRDHILGELLGALARKRAYFAAAGNRAELARLDALGELSGITGFRRFDGRVIAPLHGFRDADDYYAQCSSGPVVRHITVPLLLVHALDDPFTTPAMLPAADALPANIRCEFSAHGGHVGFVQGVPWQPRYWLEERIADWFATRLRGTADSSSRAAMRSSGPDAPLLR